MLGGIEKEKSGLEVAVVQISSYYRHLAALISPVGNNLMILV